MNLKQSIKKTTEFLVGKIYGFHKTENPAHGTDHPELHLVKPPKQTIFSDCAVKDLAPLNPLLIPHGVACEYLKEAILKINKTEGFQVLELTNAQNQRREYLVKSGIWGAQNLRMFFGKSGSKEQELSRFHIKTNRSGHPVVCRQETDTGFEARLVAIKGTVMEEKEAQVAMKTVASIGKNGKLPQWAVNISKTMKKFESDVKRLKKKKNASLLDYANMSHNTACKVLGLNSKKKHLNREIELAFKARMTQVHPDKTSHLSLNTEEISQSLLWAKNHLTPL